MGWAKLRTPKPVAVQVVETTADLTDKLTRMRTQSFGDRPNSGAQVIAIDNQQRYQHISGFGAAMTDSSAWLALRRTFSG